MEQTDTSSFNERVYSICKQIPFGRVSTYGEIARALGCKGYQAVGNALNKNPWGIWSCNDERMVPCHRVVGADGHVGGFALGVENKIMILAKEGVVVAEGKVVDFEKKLVKSEELKSLLYHPITDKPKPCSKSS